MSRALVQPIPVRAFPAPVDAPIPPRWCTECGLRARHTVSVPGVLEEVVLEGDPVPATHVVTERGVNPTEWWGCTVHAEEALATGARAITPIGEWFRAARELWNAQDAVARLKGSDPL